MRDRGSAVLLWARSLSLLRTLLIYALTILGAAATLLPFVWLCLGSFKSNADIGAIPLRWLPTKWLVQNYSKVWELMPFARMYANSIVVAVAQTAGVLVTASLGAYGFSRMKFYGREVIFFAYLSTIMIPIWVTIIPVFRIIERLGWVNTYQGLIVPGMASALSTFLLRQFFLSIPADLEEAALIDGATRLQILTRVVVPVAKPALLTVGLITFMESWNGFIWPLIVAQDESMQTLPLGLSRLALFFGGQSWVRIEWGPLMAATLMTILPILLLYAFLQNYFIKGIALTGMK
jgi:multiple sugar transport system permease protein